MIVRRVDDTVKRVDDVVKMVDDSEEGCCCCCGGPSRAMKTSVNPTV